MALSVLNFTNRIISVVRIRSYKSVGGRRFIAPLCRELKQGVVVSTTPLCANGLHCKTVLPEKEV